MSRTASSRHASRHSSNQSVELSIDQSHDQSNDKSNSRSTSRSASNRSHLSSEYSLSDLERDKAIEMHWVHPFRVPYVSSDGFAMNSVNSVNRRQSVNNQSDSIDCSLLFQHNRLDDSLDLFLVYPALDLPDMSHDKSTNQPTNRSPATAVDRRVLTYHGKLADVRPKGRKEPDMERYRQLLFKAFKQSSEWANMFDYVLKTNQSTSQSSSHSINRGNAHSFELVIYENITEGGNVIGISKAEIPLTDGLSNQSTSDSFNQSSNQLTDVYNQRLADMIFRWFSADARTKRVMVSTERAVNLSKEMIDFSQSLVDDQSINPSLDQSISRLLPILNQRKTQIRSVREVIEKMKKLIDETINKANSPVDSDSSDEETESDVEPLISSVNQSINQSGNHSDDGMTLDITLVESTDRPHNPSMVNQTFMDSTLSLDLGTMEFTQSMDPSTDTDQSINQPMRTAANQPPARRERPPALFDQDETITPTTNQSLTRRPVRKRVRVQAPVNQPTTNRSTSQSSSSPVSPTSTSSSPTTLAVPAGRPANQSIGSSLRSSMKSKKPTTTGDDLFEQMQ